MTLQPPVPDPRMVLHFLKVLAIFLFLAAAIWGFKFICAGDGLVGE